MARAKDTKERMAGVERLLELLEASRKSLSSSEVTSLVDCCVDLLKDNNFRVSQGGLQALDSAAVLSGDHLKLHFNALVPATVERLGDAKQPVRDAARRLLITLMQVSSPTLIVERAGSSAWTHKSWRVREEFARTVTTAISLYASTELPLQRAILPPILQMLYDPNPSVREAAILCIEEMYAQIGLQFREELHRHQLPSSMVKDINARLERIEPKQHSSNGRPVDVKLSNHNPKRSSPKAKNSSREVSLFSGESDVTEKPVDPIKVYSEKELIREFEKIASILVPEKDWSVRIGAMQRIEGLVVGGATDYPCFRGLLKQLVNPLSTQLADRRSSIVKQACHLLNFLSKELLGDFEACAEMFIPVLFKLVVITVLVIAESADNCIKTMLRNCKVPRVLPRVADTAKHDRSSILRARCCEYALLILEYWADAPEINRSADLYEDLIKCCVGDAMSEVRATARACYRMFSKTWPERSRRLFSQFDPVIQRIVNDEDGGMHRRHASPLLRDRNPQMSLNTHNSTPSNPPGYGTSAIVAMDRNTTLPSVPSLSSGLYSSQSNKGSSTERSLESMLHSSKEKVTAIESMLKGLDFDRVKSSSLDLGVDTPSSRDPPFPLAVPASNNSHSMSRSSNHDGGLALSDIMTQIQASRNTAKPSNETTSSLSSYTARRVEKHQERNSFEDHNDVRVARRSVTRHYLDTQPRDSHSHSHHVPNFQRPLSRKNVPGRMSANRRRSFDDSQLSSVEIPSYSDGPASLNDALTDGLGSNSDWHARVAAFNYLHSLLQQGPRGIQEVIQSFEKVMKMFFQHLDDPHHKVAQAALTTLSDLIPSCRKPFESYMERILPHVFSRLIDPKESVRQPCSSTLTIVGKIYTADSLLPALLRSLDEQRSPKAKLAVIEFAVTSFNRNITNPEGYANIGILKLWLAKLTPLVYDKNAKLKETAITCIISVYTHFDATSVLNYILSLPVEEQNSLRRALKQLTPRIEVDLMNYLQQRKDRQRLKSSYDPYDVVGTSSEEGYIGVSRKVPVFGRYSSGSVDSDGGRKWNPEDQLYQGFEIGGPNTDVVASNGDKVRSWTTRSENLEGNPNMEVSSISHIDGLNHDDEVTPEVDFSLLKITELKMNSSVDNGPSIPQILSQICNGNEEYSTASKCSALQQLVDASLVNDSSIWTKYFNQILTAVLEVLDDSDSSIRELALSLLVEMLKNQKEAMEDSIEIVVDKILHVTKDANPKVASEAEHCLTIVMSQYDSSRCLSVIVPLLVTEDEKTLVTSITCLTKLVGRLSQDELTAQLPSFLPALFDAFSNQSADVRKTVVFCLVDIYIMLGKAFLPHLEGLNSTQLRLVTIYANRISQARTGTPIQG